MLYASGLSLLVFQEYLRLWLSLGLWSCSESKAALRGVIRLQLGRGEIKADNYSSF